MNRKLIPEKWGHLPRETIRRFQAQRLEKYLRDTVLPFSPYYRQLFANHGLGPRTVRTLEDLEQVPFTSKLDLMGIHGNSRVSDFIITPDQSVLSRRGRNILEALVFGKHPVQSRLENEFRPVFMTSTTGRSAEAIPFLYSNYDLANLAVAGRRIMEVCGARRDFRLVNMFPYAPHLAFWLTHYASTSFGVFSIGTGGGKLMGTDGCLRIVEKIKPDVLIGMPTFLYHVLQHAIEQGRNLNGIKRLVLGGEKTADGMRKKLHSMCRKLGSVNVDVVTTYGFTEAKMAWAECPVAVGQEPSGYHLYPDLGVLEVINPKTGAVVPEGEPGEIVFTPLDARGTVVLRYRTGDLIERGLTYEPCPYCGRSVPRLLGKISRTAEVKSMQLEKLKGTLVDFNELEHVLDDTPNVGAWQLEIRKLNDDPLELDELVLFVHKLNPIAEDRLSRELNARFLERTEIRPNRIVFQDLGEMRERLGVGSQIKEQKIVDRRPQNCGARVDDASAQAAGVEAIPRPAAKCEV